MNLEKFFLVSENLQKRLSESGIPSAINHVVNALENQINQPNNENLTKISEQLNNLEEKYKIADFGSIPQTWSEILSVFRIGRMLDPEYPQRVRELISSKQPLLNEARDIIKEDTQALGQVTSHINSLIQVLNGLGIEKYEIEPGEAELSVLIPRDLFSNELIKFLKDVNKFERFISTSSEIAIGAVENVKLRQISTTDPIIFVVAAAPTVLFVLKSINEILEGYSKVLNIRKAKKEIEALDIDKHFAEDLEKEAKNHMKKVINDFVESIRPQISKGRSEEKANELSARFQRMMLDMASRIDHGMRIEGWAEEMPEDEESDNETRETIRKIQRLASDPQKFIAEGEPILNLPPPSHDEDENE